MVFLSWKKSVTISVTAHRFLNFPSFHLVTDFSNKGPVSVFSNINTGEEIYIFFNPWLPETIPYWGKRISFKATTNSLQEKQNKIKQNGIWRAKLKSHNLVRAYCCSWQQSHTQIDGGGERWGSMRMHERNVRRAWRGALNIKDNSNGKLLWHILK